MVRQVSPKCGSFITVIKTSAKPCESKGSAMAIHGCGSNSAEPSYSVVTGGTPHAIASSTALTKDRQGGQDQCVRSADNPPGSSICPTKRTRTSPGPPLKSRATFQAQPLHTRQMPQRLTATRTPCVELDHPETPQSGCLIVGRDKTLRPQHSEPGGSVFWQTIKPCTADRTIWLLTTTARRDHGGAVKRRQPTISQPITPLFHQEA